MVTHANPIIWSDFPDPDVIRVEDTYYMVSTTMHMMPGGAVLRSYDLANWEMVCYLFDTLDGTPAQQLQGREHIYAKGMWAPCIRYHNGMFYVVFSAWDTQKTYLYTSRSIEGPWQKSYIEGFYHDCTLLFDDDGRVYLVYGNTQIRLTELDASLSGLKAGGLNRVLVTDQSTVRLGFEGSHLYKINGKYYLFMIHWPADGHARRSQACWMADRLDGVFTGGDVLDDDMGYHNAGVAQGGLVDTPDGQWYAMLFQDHGAVGRVPVLVPVRWQDDKPVFGVQGRVPLQLNLPSTRPSHRYAPLFTGDDFTYAAGEKLNLLWQWNHEPVQTAWSVTERPGHLRLRSERIAPNVIRAVNTLTQRTFGPTCEGRTLLDGTGLQEGDYAGLCLLQSHYGCIALNKRQGQYDVVMLTQGQYHDQAPQPIPCDTSPAREVARVRVDTPIVALALRCDFEDNRDTAAFYYRSGATWHKLGDTLPLHYLLDHFMGGRFGLFLYATQTIGGHADFDWFRYHCPAPQHVADV